MRKILSLLTLLLCVCSGAWAQASTTSDDRYALGTIDFSTIGTLTANTTYWHHGVKFYSGNSTSISASNNTWSEGVTIPAYIENKIAGRDTDKGKWGSNGTGKQYTMSGFACSQHTIGVHVNQSCTITIVVNKNLAEDTDDAAITAFLDGTPYSTAWTSTTYKQEGNPLNVSSTREDASNAPGRYTLTITINEDDLNNGEAVVKLFNSSSGTGSGKLFCYESITVSLKTVSTQTFSGVKVAGEALIQDATTNGYSVEGNTITLTDDVTYMTAPTDITLTNHIVYFDQSEADVDVAVTFDGIVTDEYYIGFATIGETAYTVKAKNIPIEMLTQTSVTGARTWDWSKLNAVEELTEETNPTKNDEFVMANMDGIRYPKFDLGFNSDFTQEMAREIVISKTQYVRRNGSGNTFQSGTIKMNFAVSGNLTIYFSGTGSSGQSGNDARYLVVNGDKGNVGTNNTEQKQETFEVNGDVTISYESGKPLRIQKLEFTPTAANIEITCEGGLASYTTTSALDFSESEAKAYIVTSTSETSATLTEVTKVPANTGIIVMGTKGETITVPFIEVDDDLDDVSENKLEAVLTDKKVEDNEAYALSKTDGKFHPVQEGVTIPAGKAYLPANLFTSNAREISLIIGDAEGGTTGISAVVNKETANNVFYNLAGQRVAQPTKGLYIVNGKKVMIK
ncbi:MAG: hypothetical protein J1E37_00235 [Prevotella sp.]|nr:hypothetical protein [Prevotella sp.]